VELASGVVEKVHADFGDSRGTLHGGVGAVAVAFGRAVIAIEFGGWFLRLVSWLRAGKNDVSRASVTTPDALPTEL
jgi:hypothetical protein